MKICTVLLAVVSAVGLATDAQAGSARQAECGNGGCRLEAELRCGTQGCTPGSDRQPVCTGPNCVIASAPACIGPHCVGFGSVEDCPVSPCSTSPETLKCGSGSGCDPQPAEVEADCPHTCRTSAEPSVACVGPNCRIPIQASACQGPNCIAPDTVGVCPNAGCQTAEMPTCGLPNCQLPFEQLLTCGGPNCIAPRSPVQMGEPFGEAMLACVGPGCRTAASVTLDCGTSGCQQSIVALQLCLTGNCNGMTMRELTVRASRCPSNCGLSDRRA